MAHYIAFLRGINVGGARIVKMDALRQALKPLGFSAVSTFIASGNVIFETSIGKTDTLEALIRERLEAALGYEVAAFVRSDGELAGIAAYKAFPPSKMNAASELGIVFLAMALGAKTRRKVIALTTKTDEFQVHGRQIYWLRRKGPGTVYSTVPLDKALGRPFTIRSSRTINKLVEKYSTVGTDRSRA